MRSVLSWISEMLRNIHFGGALSGIEANRFSQSTFWNLGPKSLASNATPARAITATMSFFTPPFGSHQPYMAQRRRSPGLEMALRRGCSVDGANEDGVALAAASAEGGRASAAAAAGELEGEV